MDAHPLLRRLFVALEARRVLRVLLRLPSDFAKPTGDVDLLVAPEDVDGLLEVAEELGFVALPGWESPPGLILVSYDRPSDHWIVLVVATPVSFRSPGLWKTDAARPGARAVEILTRPLRPQARGGLVIYDRYVYEARLPAKPPLLAAKRLYLWVLGHAVPAPDAAVVLDVAEDVAYGRKQENPPEELESERRVYADLAASEPRIELVDASKPPDAVRADVTALVWEKVAARWAIGREGCKPAAD